MAEKEKKEDVKEPKAAGGGNNKLLLIVIILLVLVLLAVGGLAAYMFLNKAPASGETAHAVEEQKEVKKKEKGQAPVFDKMDAFVVNLSGGSSMLQIELQTELVDEKAKEQLKVYLPKVRSALILLLSAKTEDELQSADGKIKLKAQIKKIINESMDAGDEELVENVLFTSFIIQQQ